MWKERKNCFTSALVVLFLVIQGQTPALAAGETTLLVTYEADQLPNLASPSFQAMDSAVGTRAVNDGLLTMSVAEQTGSINNVRFDPLVDSDFAAFAFRAKIDSSQPSLDGVIPGAVVQVRWGGQSGSLVLFVAPDGIKLNKAGINNPETVASIDTTAFHTYILHKHASESLALFIDGQSVFEKPLQEFRTLYSHTGWESFSNNPSSATTWDYFRYAIGPDALTAISPIPEPPIAISMPMGLAVVLRARSRSTRNSPVFET